MDIVELYREACRADRKAAPPLTPEEQWQNKKKAAWRRTFRLDWPLLCLLVEAFLLYGLHLNHSNWLFAPPLVCLVLGFVALGMRDGTHTRIDRRIEDQDSDEYWLLTCFDQVEQDPRSYFLYDHTPRLLFYWIWRLRNRVNPFSVSEPEEEIVDPTSQKVIMKVIDYLEARIKEEDSAARNKIEADLRSAKKSLAKLSQVAESLKKHIRPLIFLCFTKLTFSERDYLEAIKGLLNLEIYIAELNRSLKCTNKITSSMLSEMAKLKEQIELHFSLENVVRNSPLRGTAMEWGQTLDQSVQGLVAISNKTQADLNDIISQLEARAEVLLLCADDLKVA